MAVEQGPMSGFRDLLADQMIPRQEMLGMIQGVYESYGYTPLKTPTLERLSTFENKLGEEADNLMYKFQDNGGRWVAMRYDMTVPLARVVAQYGSQLPMPYKRYTIGEVWRGDRPQAGRYREFTQFDADTVGTTSPIVDAEVVAMMSDAMTALGANSLIRVNNRRILDGLVEATGVEDKSGFITSTIDKIDKIGKDDVLAQIRQEFGDKVAGLVDSYLSIDGAPLERLDKMGRLFSGSEAVAEGVDNLHAVFRMLTESGYSLDSVVFDQTIARGLSYYTGIIYETTLKDLPALGSVCSGGRYDKLVKALGGPDLPAVGTSIGVDRLFDGLQQLGLLKEAKTNTNVLLTNFDTGDAPHYMRIATALRKAGLATEVHFDPKKKLGQQIGIADKMGIPYVVIMGSREMERGVAVVRTLATRDQIEVPLNELPEAINRLRSQ